jgi:hypothetical protein
LSGIFAQPELQPASQAAAATTADCRLQNGEEQMMLQPISSAAVAVQPQLQRRKKLKQAHLINNSMLHISFSGQAKNVENL